mgnify:CR=1 FL=1
MNDGTDTPFSLKFTADAIDRVKHLNERDSTSDVDKALRIYVDSGGCSGFQYNFEMTDEVVTENDYIFVSECGTRFIVDDITLDMINQSTVDYKIEMILSSFEVHANPKAELGCSCGTSFSPKNA